MAVATVAAARSAQRRLSCNPKMRVQSRSRAQQGEVLQEMTLIFCVRVVGGIKVSTVFVFVEANRIETVFSLSTHTCHMVNI